jgi:chromosome segregation ATPase
MAEEKTIDELQDEIAELQLKNEALENEVAAHKDANQANEKKVADLEAQLKAVVSVSPEEVKAKPEAVKLEEPVEMDGKHYQILVAKVTIPGKGVMTALEIASEEGLETLAHLVAIESGVIKEVQ